MSLDDLSDAILAAVRQAIKDGCTQAEARLPDQEPPQGDDWVIYAVFANGDEPITLWIR